MKKTLLLSVAASAFIMAGGDIAPVEPVVEAPAVASGWDFSGTAKLYYQTSDAIPGQLATGPADDLFSQDSSYANAGVQLRAMNSDVIAGIGAGIELSGLATLGLEEDVVSGVMQLPDNTDLTGGWISQAYLTYGFGNTSIKVGRQELPKSLSPMAYSEDWNVFANTFDAALIVNSDLPDTTAVLAWVKRNNYNAMGGLMNDFNPTNPLDDGAGAFMLTLQNKSIENLTLTGSYYTLSDFVDVLWGDIAYDAGDFNIAVQAANFDPDLVGADSSQLFGAKIGATFNGVNLGLAYNTFDDTFPHQLGGTTSAAYTCTVANQLLGGAIELDADKFVVSASADVLGGNLYAAYANTSDALIFGDTDEFDVVYSANVTDEFGVVAAFVNVDNDFIGDDVNVIRLVGTYNF
jgi:hypothetical protein